ncbi:MAG: DUF190 domain-containing protein, partial [Bacteroidota bacterium]
MESFRAGSRIHTAKRLRLSEDLRLVIEIVDTAEKIDNFVQELLERAGWGGMITEERAHNRH